jgi:thiamine-monophosphate kinase
VTAGVALAEAGLVSAMIDVSDGVLGDLTHICELSGVGARLELSGLPLSDEYRAVCAADPYALALSGGEDYELLFCIAKDKRLEVEALLKTLGLRFSVIGEIIEGSAVELVAPGGGAYQPERGGFDHFG